MANPFVHMELNTPDLGAAKKFYGELFGWAFNDMQMGPGMTYSTFKPDDGPGGGMMTTPGAPTQWLNYVGVENVTDSMEKAKSLGAEVIVPVQEVPGMGWFSILKDPTGAPIAIWQSKMPG